MEVRFVLLAAQIRRGACLVMHEQAYDIFVWTCREDMEGAGICYP